MSIIMAPIKMDITRAGARKSPLIRQIAIPSKPRAEVVQRRKASPYTEAEVIRARAETGVNLIQVEIITGRSVKYGLCRKILKTTEVVANGPRFDPLVAKPRD